MKKKEKQWVYPVRECGICFPSPEERAPYGKVFPKTPPKLKKPGKRKRR